ncbi:putative nucleotide-binding alpha-beta plait domain-containing protein [Medicago truncatula]|uniref:Putative nucleotide-binding alpha-beta plait domain-containing protein n=1 Tax=Medicago truncatula TaxID=3880 RepID=A0A396HF91_MEDTR|nr:putative nucleotide-binding alpha-beta plait domain-containing protein [Medicago truncatula]
MDSNGHSKGHGFVQFDNDQSAKNAIEKLDGMLMNDKKVYVGYLFGVKKGHHLSSLMYSAATAVEKLNGSTTNDGKQGRRFCCFYTPEEASKAINEMNGKMIGQKPVYVSVAQRKEERKAQLQVKLVFIL